MIQRLASCLLLAVSLRAAEFQNGQAARAVIGQPSFSAREAGASTIALTVGKNRLYAADSSGHVLTFDLTKVLALNDDPGDRPAPLCTACGFPPVANTSQSVIPGIAGVAVLGKTVIMVDSPRHRILIWKDVSSPRSIQGPDVILGRSSDGSVSASTLVDPVSVAFDGKRVFAGDAALHRVLIWNSLPVQDDQAADAVLGQPNFTSAGSPESSGPDSIVVPAALASDGRNLFVADSAARRILVFSAGDFAVSSAAIVNSASLAAGPLAPGTLINIKTSESLNLSDMRQDQAARRLPKHLNGVEVLFNGMALPLLSVKSGSIEAQLPYDIAGLTSASLSIRTEHDGTVALSNAVALKIATAAPGLYAFGGTEPRTGLLLHGGSAKSGVPASPVTGDSPAHPSEELTVWATGLGAVDDSDAASRVTAGIPFSGPAAPVLSALSATVDGRPVEVRSASLTEGAVGVYEIHILLPADLHAGPNAALVVSQSGYTSNVVLFPVTSTQTEE
jgi:uncharacterized protein (TIGR03437 family)